jgi:hypothetical protein
MLATGRRMIQTAQIRQSQILCAENASTAKIPTRRMNTAMYVVDASAVAKMNSIAHVAHFRLFFARASSP